MKELWIKQTVYRRHLILDEEVEEVKHMLEHDENSYHTVADFYCKNDDLEYDNEEVVLPHKFEIKSI